MFLYERYYLLRYHVNYRYVFPNQPTCVLFAMVFSNILAGELGYTQKEIYHFGMAVHRLAGFNSPSDDLLTDYCHRNPTVDELYFKLQKLNLYSASAPIKKWGKLNCWNINYQLSNYIYMYYIMFLTVCFSMDISNAVFIFQCHRMPWTCLYITPGRVQITQIHHDTVYFMKHYLAVIVYGIYTVTHVMIISSNQF